MIDNQSNEEWRPLPRYEGLYQISSLGRVKSVSRTVTQKNGTIIPVEERIIKPQKSSTGYLNFNAWKNGIGENFSVHVVVCEAFHGPRPPGMYAAHENGTRTDNRSENLSWKTPKENSADRIRHGTMPKWSRPYHKILRGEKLPTSKLKEFQVKEIRELAANGILSLTEIAKTYGITPSTAHNVINRITWKHV